MGGGVGDNSAVEQEEMWSETCVGTMARLLTERFPHSDYSSAFSSAGHGYVHPPRLSQRRNVLAGQDCSLSASEKVCQDEWKGLAQCGRTAMCADKLHFPRSVAGHLFGEYLVVPSVVQQNEPTAHSVVELGHGGSSEEGRTGFRKLRSLGARVMLSLFKAYCCRLDGRNRGEHGCFVQASGRSRAPTVARHCFAIALSHSRCSAGRVYILLC